MPSGVELDASALGFAGETREVTLYVEGIAVTAATADRRILVEVDADGSGTDYDFCLPDAVLTTVCRLNITAYRDFARSSVVPEAEEEEPGLVLMHNSDDDNGNGIPDYNDNLPPVTPIQQEDDLRALDLTFENLPVPSGFTVKLIREGQGTVAMWANPTKETFVQLPDVSPVPPSPRTRHVEGIDPGSITLKLQLVAADGTVVHEDRLKVRVVSIDVDVDSDNTNRHAPPDRSAAEEEIEEVVPGKVLIANIDDDDADGTPDNSDQTPNGADDILNDMARIVVQVYGDNIGTVRLSATDYGKVRVFTTGGVYLIGPEAGHNQEMDVGAGLFTGGVCNLSVEGVAIGVTTLSAQIRMTDGTYICGDHVRITVADTLESMPQGFQHVQQHKDTQMLCVAAHPSAPSPPWWPTVRCPRAAANSHNWDNDHVSYLGACDHCRMYCTRASVRMIGLHYGGDVSQDRISYHCRATFYAGPPANDLGHDEGLWPREPLSWSLGLAPADIDERVNSPSRTNHNDDWQFMANAIVCYRPVLLVREFAGAPPVLHSNAVCGVRITAAGTRQIRLCDPTVANPDWRDFSAITIERLLAVSDSKISSISARHDEASVSTHSDADGIVDFDEDNRLTEFKAAEYNLDKANPDSGGDARNDKQHVADCYAVP